MVRTDRYVNPFQQEAKIFKNNNNNNFINNYKKSLVSHSFFTYYLKVGLYTTLDYL